MKLMKYLRSESKQACKSPLSPLPSFFFFFLLLVFFFFFSADFHIWQKSILDKEVQTSNRQIENKQWDCLVVALIINS